MISRTKEDQKSIFPSWGKYSLAGKTLHAPVYGTIVVQI